MLKKKFIIPTMAIMLIASSGVVSAKNTYKTVVVKTAQVTAKSGLNVRETPKIEADNKIGVVLNGEEFKVLEEKNGWCKIQIGKEIGWVSSSYVNIRSEKVKVEVLDNKKHMYVNVSGLNFREEANINSKIQDVLPKGTKVEVLEEFKGWTKVKVNNKEGYLGSRYLTEKLEVEKPLLDTSNRGENFNKADIIELAFKQLGKPYVYAAEGPSEFDCSGLVQYVFKNAGGVNLPRTSKAQSQVGETVERNDLQPGDLVFSSTNGSGTVTHVGIYIGNNEVIHAPKPGDVVKKIKINNSYWEKAYLWAKRIF